MERTFIMVKPDGVQRGLVGELISKWERRGFKLLACKLFTPSSEVVTNHYDEHKTKSFFPGLLNFMTSGPVVAMVWEGKNIVKISRDMIGATNPLNATPGTVRGDYCVTVGKNVIHGSDSVESAQREIAIWFSPHDVHEWNQLLSQTIYE